MNEDEYIKRIGKTIQSLRNQKGIKQIELAALVGIEDSALRRIESGRTNPTIKTLFKISESLETSVEFLLLEDDEERLYLETIRNMKADLKNRMPNPINWKKSKSK